MLAFFIDADNLCTSPWVDEAFRQLESLDQNIALRRAYGSTEKLKGLAGVLQARHIRPFVNAALSKNTTDVALAVDVMELSFQVPRPDIIAIGSGDADFVPLVLRLRERGFRVLCVSQHGKMAPEAVQAYEQVILVGQASPSPEAVQLPVPAMQVAPAPPAPAKKAAARKASARKTVAKKAAAKTAAKTAAKKVAAKKTRPAAPKPADAGPVSVAQILEAVSALRSGQALPLNDVAKRLHDAKLLGKNVSSPKLFKKFPHHFELLPAQSRQPHQVRYIAEP